jgi:FkbM family methyltransferase
MKYLQSTNHDRTEEYLSKFNRENVLKLLIKDTAPIIFDVGANEGLSLDEFKTWWKNSIVHCFEPQEECVDILINKSQTYKKSDVFINRNAVGKIEKNNVDFYSHDIHSGLSGFNKINENSLDSVYLNELKTNSNSNTKLNQYMNKLNTKTLVNLIRLDDYIVDNEIDRINLLKIDTQGYEPEVLSGLGKRLEDVDVVLTELMFYDYYNRSLSFSDIEKYLIPAGFQLYDINHISKNPMNGRTDWVDVIYVNNRYIDK